MSFPVNQLHSDYNVNAAVFDVFYQTLIPPLNNGPPSAALTRMQNGFLHAIRVLEDRNADLLARHDSLTEIIEEVEGGVTESDSELDLNDEKIAGLEKEIEELKKHASFIKKEPESEGKGDIKMVFIMTHVVEKRRLLDIEAEKWTGVFRNV